MQLTILAWYAESDWDELRRISVDRNTLPADYADWLQSAEQHERNLADQGQLVKRVLIQPTQLMVWAIERGLPVNSETRSRYAADLNQRQNAAL